MGGPQCGEQRGSRPKHGTTVDVLSARADGSGRRCCRSGDVKRSACPCQQTPLRADEQEVCPRLYTPATDLEETAVGRGNKSTVGTNTADFPRSLCKWYMRELVKMLWTQRAKKTERCGNGMERKKGKDMESIGKK